MGHELRPRNGAFPSAAEVARLLTVAFKYVKTDPDDGLKQAMSRAEWIEHAPARLFLGHHQEALEFAANLRKLRSGEALTIDFSDYTNESLRIVVIPGEAIKFGYSSKAEELSRKSLVEKCAQVLDCKLVTF